MTLTILAILWLVALSAPPSALSFVVLGFAAAVAGAEMVRWLLAESKEKASVGPLREEFTLLALLLSVNLILFAGICNYPFFRYLIGLLPLFAAATAATVIAVGSSRRWGAAALTACLVLCIIVQLGPFAVTTSLAEAAQRVSNDQFADGFGYLPCNLNSYQSLRLEHEFPRFCSLPWEYAQELTRDYQGPIGAVVRYLQEHARSGEVLVTTYEHFPLMFYTNLKVYSARTSGDLKNLPDWILIHGIEKMLFSERLTQVVRDPNEYQQALITAHDFPFENIPEPNWHQFRTPSEGPRVTLFHRVR